MKNLILLALLFTCLFATAQDTVKKDTVVMAYFERYDTTKANIIHVVGRRLKATQGFVVKKGFIYQDKGKWLWSQRPEVFLFLDKKKKKITGSIINYKEQ